MIPNPSTTTSTTPGTQAPVPDAPAPQASAAGSPSAPQPAPSAPAGPATPVAPATPPTPVQIFWDVARLAFALMTRLIGVLQPIQSYYLEQSRQAMRVCTELCRVMLTIRFAPERITTAQLRHLHRARHILQALFNYSLGARTPSSATPANTSSPSPNSLGTRTPSSATTPSPTVHAVPEVPAVPEVSSPSTPSPATSHAPAASPKAPSSPALNLEHLTSNNSHTSHASPSPHSALRTCPSPLTFRTPTP